MEPKKLARIAPGAVIALAVSALMFTNFYVHAPDEGQPGGPIKGLSPAQLRKFYETREIFKKEFTPEEGLGPIFNGKSCFECHGQPTVVGGEGRDVTSTGVVRIGRRIPNGRYHSTPLREHITDYTREDVELLFFDGGPALQRKSITSEFPNKYPPDCQIEIGTVPPQAELISLRHAGPLFGFGLIQSIPDSQILENIFKQAAINPKLAGRATSKADPLTSDRHIGRFGWKCQHANLLSFTNEALLMEMGITSYTLHVEKSAKGVRSFPSCIYKYIPKEPNDTGKIAAQLAYHQALLAPPPRGPITGAAKRGEVLFKKLECSVCHTPELSTAPLVYLVDPDSPAPEYRSIEVKALENQPVRAYSDFLLHQMGPALADGLPQSGAKGGEWRTTPLWGLRFKKFYLHDGRTTDLNEAITLHGGQADEVKQHYLKMDEKEKSDLLAFLKSL